WETICGVVFPASITGIATAVVLGIARVIGETMVVLMVAGGAAMIPHSLFDPVRPMPANIAAEMGNAAFRSDHYHAPFAICLVLFVTTFLFNLQASYFANKYRRVGEAICCWVRKSAIVAVAISRRLPSAFSGRRPPSICWR